MTAGWETKPLGELIQQIETRDPRKEPERAFEYVDVSAVSNKSHMIEGSEALLGNDAPSRARRVIRTGDVIFATIRPTLNRTAIVPSSLEDQVCSTGYFVARPDPTASLDSRFLFYFLLSPEVQVRMENIQRGASYPAVSDGDMREQPVPLPPLEEQKRIVAILDAAFADIDSAEAGVLDASKDVGDMFDSFLAYLLKASGEWQQRTLNDVALDFGRGRSRHRPRNDKALYGGNYPFIQTGDIRAARHVLSSASESYNEVGLAQSKLWPEGTLCVTIAANIAETAVLGIDACFPDSVIGLVPNPDLVETDFLEYLLTHFRGVMVAQGKGSAQANINLATFERLLFPVPTLNEQREIVSRFEEFTTEVDELRSVLESKQSLLTTLRQSLLHQAFTGQL